MPNLEWSKQAAYLLANLKLKMFIGLNQAYYWRYKCNTHKNYD